MMIPRPVSVKRADDDTFFRLDAHTGVADNGLGHITEDFNEFMDKAFGYRLKASPDGGIVFALDMALEPELGTEGYGIKITPRGVILRAAAPKGIFYGVQTLKQIIVRHYALETVLIPSMDIKDKPLYGYRGYMLDVCRHFFSVEDILKIVDVLALHKINILHLHLTDDQGWRVQIDRYPRLTAIGGGRKQTLGDGRWHGGYYTQEDIRRIVSYCEQKYITVIPEIDMPGHSMAAIAAYPHLSCRGETIEVAESFGIKSDILCAGKESTYQFIYGVLDEVAELFPGPYVHLGGDEAPKDRWEECPHCRRMLRDNHLERMEELQGLFLNRIIAHLKKKGKRAICWNESLYSGMLDTDTVCHYWQDGKEAKTVKEALENGRSVIVSRFKPYYLDYPHTMHPLKAVYAFAPEIADGNILGVEAPLWTEYVADLSRAEYMTYPRLGAVAEIGWSGRAHRDYDDFTKRLPVYLRLLDIYNVGYAGPEDRDPGPIKGLGQMLDFVKRASFLSKANVQSMRDSIRANRNIAKARKGMKNLRPNP